MLCRSSFALRMISWRVLFPSSSIFISNGLDLSFDGLPNLRTDSIRGTRLNSSFMMFRNVCSSLSWSVVDFSGMLNATTFFLLFSRSKYSSTSSTSSFFFYYCVLFNVLTSVGVAYNLVYCASEATEVSCYIGV